MTKRKKKLQEPTIRHPNYLWIYRKRMNFSQKRVALLLGHKTTTHVSDYERGRRLPSLRTALKLEIILRIPIAFVYGEQYNTLKRNIREVESRLMHIAE